MNIFFFNPCRNGDVHVSRTYIRDIINKLPNNKYYYIQNHLYTRGFILRDIRDLNKSSFDVNRINPDASIIQMPEATFVNTWYGQSNFKYFPPLSKNNADSCSFYILYDLFKDIFNFLNIELESFQFYLPQINFDRIEKTKEIDIFFQNNTFEKYVLICDNPVQSGQSSNFDFKPILKELSDTYKDVAFISTSPNNFNHSPNLFSTNEIINLDFDLNEISYLSTKCDTIVGRGSGPYTFSLISENLLNESKKFVAFTNTEIVGLGLRQNDYKCQLNWSNDYSQDNIIKKIIEFL